MANKVWQQISYNQSADVEKEDPYTLEGRLLKALDEIQRLKIQLGEATVMILNLERKLTEIKAR